MNNTEDIKRTLQNPAILPSYRQTLEKRLKELEIRQLPEAPKPAAPEKSKPYAGISNMTSEEIVQYYSTGQFYRIDQPISGQEALQSLYRRLSILGHGREVAARVAAAIKCMGGEVPEMECIRIDDLLKKE